MGKLVEVEEMFQVSKSQNLALDKFLDSILVFLKLFEEKTKFISCLYPSRPNLKKASNEIFNVR